MTDPLEPYWTALGKFVHRYAKIEETLNMVLRISAGVTHKQGRALFSGTRVTNAISFVRRSHLAEGKPLSPWLEKAFPKLGELTTARDEILHQGFTLSGDLIEVSNRSRTNPETATTRRYSLNDIINMEADACVVHACLNMWWLEQRYPKSRLSMREREQQIAETPWRHKPPQPSNRQGRSAKTRPKPKAPPPPFQA